jgi:DNA-directed RNA polymerase subunit beta'
MGRLIPAGTGLPAYKRLQVVVEGAEQAASSGGYIAPRPMPPPEALTAVNEEE